MYKNPDKESPRNTDKLTVGLEGNLSKQSKVC